MGTTDPEFRKSLHFALPSGALFELLVSEEAATHWMGAEVEIDPEPGGDFLVRQAGWPEVVGEITELAAPHRIQVRWRADEWDGPLTSTVDILDEPEAGCRLTLWETGFGTDDDLLRRRDWLWSHYLVRLAAVGAQLSSPGAAQPG